MEDRKQIFISVFNHGGIQLAKNHIQSLISNGITNYTAYCTGDNTVTELQSCGINAEKYKFEVDEGTMRFGSGDFNRLSFLRYLVIIKLLRSGYDVWYMDVDTVVRCNLNNKFRQLVANENINIWFQDDLNMLCTGCMLFRCSPATIDFIVNFYNYFFHMDETRKYAENDQIVMNQFIQMYDRNLFKFGILSYQQFPNGVRYFGKDFVDTNPQTEIARNQYLTVKEPPMFVHANWMVGITKKINALKKYKLWYL